MVSEFNTLDEMWLWSAQYLLSHGHGEGSPSRGGAVYRETMGYAARLLDPAANFLFNPVRKISPHYAAAEMLWYLSGKRNPEALLPYAPQYERFLDDGIAFGAYGYRWTDTDASFQRGQEETETNHAGQLETLHTLLSVKRDTRQAILTCWNAGDLSHALVGDKKDLPCTLTLHFQIRDNKLYLTTTMRSNDIWLGMPYDVFCFTCLQMLLASELNVGLGWYQHQAGSMHVYDRNADKFKEAANVYTFRTASLEYQHNTSGLFDRAAGAVRLEKHNRKIGAFAKDGPGICGGDYTLLTQLVAMAACKWSPRALDAIKNPILAKYMEVNDYVSH